MMGQASPNKAGQSRDFLKLPPKKVVVISQEEEHSIGSILQQRELVVKPSPEALDGGEETLSEEYDGKMRTGTISFISEAVVRQKQSTGYMEYKTKEFKPDDLPKLLKMMIDQSTVSIAWKNAEKRFDFFMMSLEPHGE